MPDAHRGAFRQGAVAYFAPLQFQARLAMETFQLDLGLAQGLGKAAGFVAMGRQFALKA